PLPAGRGWPLPERGGDPHTEGLGAAPDPGSPPGVRIGICRGIRSLHPPGAGRRFLPDLLYCKGEWKMNDYMIRATAGQGKIRAFAATTRDLVEEARKRHDTSPVVTAALGRLLTAGVMMGSMMKGEKDTVTLK